MDEQRLCKHCKKNYAVRSYEENGARELYCLECYSRLFLDGEGSEGSLTKCPYCGTALSQVRASKLVGCAHCYQTMETGIFPLVQKMQGGRAHTGKTPPGCDFSGAFGESYRAQVIARSRFERQCHELKVIIKSLQTEGNVKEAKVYEERLVAMQEKGSIEEEDVWKTHLTLSKRP